MILLQLHGKRTLDGIFWDNISKMSFCILLWILKNIHTHVSTIIIKIRNTSHLEVAQVILNQQHTCQWLYATLEPVPPTPAPSNYWSHLTSMVLPFPDHINRITQSVTFSLTSFDQQSAFKIYPCCGLSVVHSFPFLSSGHYSLHPVSSFIPSPLSGHLSCFQLECVLVHLGC